MNIFIIVFLIVIHQYSYSNEYVEERINFANFLIDNFSCDQDITNKELTKLIFEYNNSVANYYSQRYELSLKLDLGSFCEIYQTNFIITEYENYLNKITTEKSTINDLDLKGCKYTQSKLRDLLSDPDKTLDIKNCVDNKLNLPLNKIYQSNKNDQKQFVIKIDLYQLIEILTKKLNENDLNVNHVSYIIELKASIIEGLWVKHLEDISKDNQKYSEPSCNTVTLLSLLNKIQILLSNISRCKIAHVNCTESFTEKLGIKLKSINKRLMKNYIQNLEFQNCIKSY